MTVWLTTLTTIAGALLGAGLTYLNSVRQKSNDAANALWKSSIERRSKQLGELYAPLQMLRSQSRGLRALLPSTEPGDASKRWRLVHHAGSIGTAWRGLHQAEPVEPPTSLGLSRDQIEVAHLLITTGDEACELIDSHAGLVDGAIPGGFREYKDHHTRLRVSWDSGIDQQPGDSDPFQGALLGSDDPDGLPPSDATRETSIDAALDTDIATIRTEHGHLLGTGPATKGAVFGSALALIGLALFIVTIVVAVTDDGGDDRILVTTPQGALCGELGAGDDGVVSVGSIEVPAGSEIEFVDSCG